MGAALGDHAPQKPAPRLRLRWLVKVGADALGFALKRCASEFEMRFLMLVFSVIMTAVIVTVVMFRTIYLLLG